MTITFQLNPLFPKCPIFNFSYIITQFPAISFKLRSVSARAWDCLIWWILTSMCLCSRCKTNQARTWPNFRSLFGFFGISYHSHWQYECNDPQIFDFILQLGILVIRLDTYSIYCIVRIFVYNPWVILNFGNAIVLIYCVAEFIMFFLNLF